jgi:hypothetical protein
MFNLTSKFFNKFCFKKPTIHYIQPKSMNLYFKKSIQPELKFINLNHFDSIIFQINKKNEVNNNSTDVFYSVDMLTKKDAIDGSIEIAKFETKKEAESALENILTKMYSPSKRMFKGVFFIAAILFGIVVIVNLLTGLIHGANPSANNLNISNLSIPQSSSAIGMNSVVPSPSEELAKQQQLQALLSQIVQQKQSQATNNANSGTPQQSPESPTQQLIQQLK